MGFKHIHEYISTDDGVDGTLLIPQLILPTLIEEVDKNLIPREMAAFVQGPNQLAKQGSTWTLDLVTPNSMNVREVGEGAEIPLDNILFTTVTFAPLKYGVAIRITREMIEDSQFELLQMNVRMAGKRFAENETNLILGQLDRAGNTVSGGATVTIANITLAMENLETNDFNATDYLVGVSVLNDLRNIDTFTEADKAGDTEMLRRGFRGIIYGMRVAMFSTNAGTNAVATTSYVFDRSQAYAIAIKRDITVENFDLPTYDMKGAALTTRIDVQALRTNAISNITSS